MKKKLGKKLQAGEEKRKYVGVIYPKGTSFRRTNRPPFAAQNDGINLCINKIKKFAQIVGTDVLDGPPQRRMLPFAKIRFFDYATTAILMVQRWFP